VLGCALLHPTYDDSIARFNQLHQPIDSTRWTHDFVKFNHH
jgi:hypothetical protein